MKTLNQDCPNVHIFVSKFWSCCSPNRNPILNRKSADWFLLVSLFTTTHKHCKKHDLIFLFISRLTKTEVLICRYADIDSLRYCYKKHAPKLCIKFTQEGPCWDVPSNSMHSPSTAPLIALPCFQLLNCKRIF